MFSLLADKVYNTIQFYFRGVITQCCTGIQPDYRGAVERNHGTKGLGGQSKRKVLRLVLNIDRLEE